MRWLIAGGLVSVAACSAGDIDLEGRPCAPGCVDGYVCHPELGECVCQIPIGCDGGQNCPQLSQVGGECPCPGAFINCAGGVEQCEFGCRTCEDDRTWSACSETECDINAPELCDNRDNDCDGLVDEAIAGCDCSPGQTAGVERCDQRDNDCNTGIDDGFPCRFDSVRPCEGGQGVETCNPSTCQWNTTCELRDGVGPGIVTGFAAVPQNGRASLSWIHPSDADLDLCVVRRTVVDIPHHHLVGDLVYVEIAPPPSSPGAVVDVGLTNSVQYGYAVFCRDRSGTWNEGVTVNNNAGEVTPTAGAAENPIDFDASDHENGQSTLTFTMPSAAIECRVRKKDDFYPGGHDDVGSQLVHTFWDQGSHEHVDGGLTNGEDYYYAVFCFNGEEWNDGFIAAQNADIAHPMDDVPVNPIDFAASDGDDSVSTLTFTMLPVAGDECRVMRRADGVYPADETEGDQVGSGFVPPGSVRLADTGLANDQTYHYAVFCRNGTTWNRGRSDVENADTGSPVDAPIGFEAVVVAGARGLTSLVVSAEVPFVDNRLYLAAITTQPYEPVTAVTGLGLDWTLASAQCGAANETGTEIWWAFGSPVGVATQVRVTLGADVQGGMVAVARYVGVNSGVPIGNVAGQNTGGTSCSDAGASNAYALGLLVQGASSVVLGSVATLTAEHSPGTGVTERDDTTLYSDPNQVGMALVEAGGSGSVAVAGTLSMSVRWALVLIELRP